MERPDFIFSYWIFAWYLLYLLGIVTYNPKFAILIGIVENICIILLMFYYNTKIRLVLLFIIMMILLKLIPIYTIWHSKINKKDIILTIILFIIYICWSIINNKSITSFSQKTKQLVVYNKNTLPGMIFLEKII